MIPSRLNENNPLRHHYRTRIWRNQLLEVKTFYSPTIGWFDLVAMWHNVEYKKNKISPTGSHWFHYVTIKIVTFPGDTMILRQEYLDREGAFNNRMPYWRI